MPRASTRVPTRRSSSYSPVQENNFNIDRFSHARRDASRPYPTLGSVMDRTATADPNEGFTDLGFRDFIQASRRVSRRKLARIETNPYATELLNRGVEFVTETNETFNSVLEARVIHTGNVGSMLMDEIAHVNERVDGRREEIEKLEKEFLGCHEGILKIEDEQEQHGMAMDRLKGEVITLKDLVRSLVAKTGELEDDKVRLTRCVSELTGEVRDLQRRCSKPEVQVEEEEGEEVLHRAGSPIIPNRAESPPARLLVRHENRLVPIDDEVIEIGSDQFYQNVGVVRRDTPRPEFVSTPWGSRCQWPALEYDPYAEFVPDSEPNSDMELPDYDDLSDVDPNEIREQNWLNEELGVNGEIITDVLRLSAEGLQIKETLAAFQQGTNKALEAMVANHQELIAGLKVRDNNIKGALARRDEKTEELENVVAVLTAQVESLQGKTCNCKEVPKLVGQGTANVPFELEYADEVVLPSPNPSFYATPPIENSVPVLTPAPASTLAASDKENCGHCALLPIHQLVKIEDEAMEVDRAEDAPRVAELSRMVTNLVEVTLGAGAPGIGDYIPITCVRSEDTNIGSTVPTDRSSRRSNSDTSFASQDRIPPRGPMRETEDRLSTTSIVLPSSHPVMEMWDQVFRSSETSGRLIGLLEGISSYQLELVVQLSAEDGDAMFREVLARRGHHYDLQDGRLMTFRPAVDRVDF
ncbi:hypothetical protein BJ322DRAFT_1113643 [Thelephora terrestris]|uniref:Uncharacterized protein n=1 Tax=Thelephora terrestris TaxID=56493 RepID=A0A9P6H4X0_9AGAM|nr:hypothetical protein BJ322DRAFT_1113643 [Thelephora terrestris]